MTAVTLAGIRANFSDALPAGSVTGATVQQLIDFVQGQAAGFNTPAAGLWQSGTEGFCHNWPGVVGTLSPTETNSLTAFPSQPRCYGGRVTIPRAGVLHDMTIGVGTTDASGAVSCAIYDLGEASPGSYTRLWTSGSVALSTIAPSGTIWAKVGDPAYTVYEGQQLLFMMSANTTTATFANKGVALAAPLPTGFGVSVGGNLGKFAFLSTAGTPHPCPTPISEANLTNTNMIVTILARLV